MGLYNTPFIGSGLKMLEAVPVGRFSAEGRKNAMSAIEERVQPDSPWPPTIIFPQGTTTNSRAITQFAKGAFVPGVPVRPVCITYHNRFADVSFVHSMIWCYYYGCCQWVNWMKVDILPPYYPSEPEKKDPKLYAANVRNEIVQMARQRGIPMQLSDHSYHDMNIFWKTKKLSKKLKKPGKLFAVDDNRLQ